MKNAKKHRSVFSAFCPFTLHSRKEWARKIFSIVASIEKQNLYMGKSWKTSTRARFEWTGMRSFAMHHFLPTWKILLHNRCNSDFLMQQYLAQVRNWWRADKNAHGRKTTSDVMTIDFCWEIFLFSQRQAQLSWWFCDFVIELRLQDIAANDSQLFWIYWVEKLQASEEIRFGYGFLCC